MNSFCSRIYQGVMKIGMYNCPHGQCMPILLPHVMRRYGSAAHGRLSELCDVCGIKATDESTKQLGGFEK